MAGHVVIEVPVPGICAEETTQGDPNLSRKVVLLALLSDGAAIMAAIRRGVREVSSSADISYKKTYLIAIGSVFIAGLAEMLGALWVSWNTHERAATGKRILYASVVTLLLGMVLDAFAYVPNK